jgi:hypothetical protein
MARSVGIGAEAREQTPTRKELAELRARVAGSQRDLDAARTEGPPRLPQQIELEIGALMQKAAAQAQRVATGTLGPSRRGRSNSSTRPASSTSSSSPRW